MCGSVIIDAEGNAPKPNGKTERDKRSEGHECLYRLFRRHRRQRTGWWRTRARRKVLCGHGELVEDDGGHWIVVVVVVVVVVEVAVFSCLLLDSGRLRQRRNGSGLVSGEGCRTSCW